MADGNFQATRIGGGVLHYADKQREVGVSGASVEQTWDLTVFPEAVREDPSFRDQLIATFQAFDGVTLVDNLEILPAGPALPEKLKVDISAADPTDKVNLFLVLPHSVVR